MKSRFLRHQFAIGSALVFAFGTAAFAQGPGHHRGGPGAGIEQVIAHVKDRLALDSSQQVMFDNALAATRTARESGRAEMQKLHASLRAELAKPEPDLAALASASDAAQTNAQASRRAVRDQWLRLYSTFSATQKGVVRDALAQRLARHEQFRAKMRERVGG